MEKKKNLSTSHKISYTVLGNSWHFDSVCCKHISPNSQFFYYVTTHAPFIQIANGSHITVSHVGSISTFTLSFSDTYLIPNPTLNLIFASQLCEFGFDFYFGSSSCCVQDAWMNQVLGKSHSQGSMFELTSLHLPFMSTTPPSYVATITPVFSLNLWHLRLGHVSDKKLRS